MAQVMELLTSEQRPSVEVAGSTPVVTSALLGRVLEFLRLLLLVCGETLILPWTRSANSCLLTLLEAGKGQQGI